MRTAKDIKLAGRKVALRIGSARYNIAPGASTTVKVKLAKGSKRLADRKGHLKVLAIASTGRSGKIALQLAAPHPRARHGEDPLGTPPPRIKSGLAPSRGGAALP